MADFVAFSWWIKALLYRGDLEAVQKKPFTLMDDFTDAIKRVPVSGIYFGHSCLK